MTTNKASPSQSQSERITAGHTAETAVPHKDAAPQKDVATASNGPWRRWLRRAEHVLAAFGAAILLLVVTPLTTMIHDALEQEDPLRPADYVICLGGDNARIIESARLLREGRAERLIVSNHGLFAERMRNMAIDWGAPADRVDVDDGSQRTRDHPVSIARRLPVDPQKDTFVVVTSATHLARSRACFAKQGYQHLVMRQPRWERTDPAIERDWKWRMKVLPNVIYECAAWVEYWLRGTV